MAAIWASALKRGAKGGCTRRFGLKASEIATRIEASSLH